MTAGAGTACHGDPETEARGERQTCRASHRLKTSGGVVNSRHREGRQSDRSKTSSGVVDSRGGHLEGHRNDHLKTSGGAFERPGPRTHEPGRPA